MTTYGRDSLVWKDDKLYFKDELQCWLVPDKTHPKMFWTKYSDGSMSSDYLNKTRSKDWAEKMLLRELNYTPEEVN